MKQAVIRGALLGLVLAVVGVGGLHKHSLLVRLPLWVLVSVAVSVAFQWFLEARRNA